MFCQVMNIVDQIVESKEKMTQIQLIFEQLRKDQQEIEKAAFEARAEKLQAQTEQILKDLQAQWRSWVSEEAVHEEQYSLYQVEEGRAKSLLSDIAELKNDRSRESPSSKVKHIRDQCKVLCEIEESWGCILRKHKGREGNSSLPMSMKVWR